MISKVKVPNEERILIVSEASCNGLVRQARGLGFRVSRQDTQEESLRGLRKEAPVVTLFDTDHPPVDALEFALNLHDVSPQTPVLLTGRDASHEAGRIQEILPDLFVGATAEPAKMLLVWCVVLGWQQRSRHSLGARA